MWLEHQATRLSPEPRPDGKTFLESDPPELPELASPPKSKKGKRARASSPRSARASSPRSVPRDTQNVSQAEAQVLHHLVTPDVIQALDAVVARADASGQLESLTFRELRNQIEHELDMEKDALHEAKNCVKQLIEERLMGMGTQPQASQAPDPENPREHPSSQTVGSPVSAPHATEDATLVQAHPKFSNLSKSIFPA